jgi:hypothetical protein
MEKIILTYQCYQDWRQMPEKEAGRFCAQCTRCIIDFREKTLEEIVMIHVNSDKPVCGIFKAEQVYYKGTAMQKRHSFQHWLALAATTLAITPSFAAMESILLKTNFIHPSSAIFDSKDKSVVKKDSVSFRGRILDENEESLIGANILVKGIMIGTVSDIEGYFELKLPDTLSQDSIKVEFSSTGYATQEKTYKLKNISNFQERIVMTLDMDGLEEVIVVGYGIFSNRQIWNTSTINLIPVSESDKHVIDRVPGVNLEQELKRQKRSRFPWYREFWQKRKQKRIN